MNFSKLAFDDLLIDVAFRVELCEALIRCRSSIRSSGVYSSSEVLSDEIFELVSEQLDSVVNRLRVFSES